MKFNDVTLLEGRIHSRRDFDTDALVPGAIGLAGAILQRSRDAGAFVPHNVPGLPAFEVCAGLQPVIGPESCEDDPGFCVLAENELILVTLILSPIRSGSEQEYLAELLSAPMLNIPQQNRSLNAIVALHAELSHLRPVVVSLPLPVGALHPDESIIAADFETCAAASILLGS